MYSVRAAAGRSLLLPLYRLLEALPSTRESALRLGLITADQMLRALVHGVENRSAGVEFLDVPAIRRVAAAFPMGTEASSVPAARPRTSE